MKIKKWEILLALMLIISVFAVSTANAFSKQQQELSGKLIRLHVIANSDSDSDQKMKLYVRDVVISQISEMLCGIDSRKEASQIISENLSEIQLSAENAVTSFGGTYNVIATLSNESYPTREYDTFSLPAGDYLSLRVMIGNGSGQNWWCVVFPPVCFTAATDTELADMNFTESEIEFITGDDNECVFKFKVLEQIELLKQFFKTLK